MNSDVPPDARPEKREGRRRRTLFRGKIVHTNGAITQSCIIRNLTAEGAQIRIPNAQNLPVKVELVDIPNAMVYEAEIIWRRAPEFGLKFLTTFPAREAPHRLTHLRRLWLANTRA